MSEMSIDPNFHRERRKDTIAQDAVTLLTKGELKLVTSLQLSDNYSPDAYKINCAKTLAFLSSLSGGKIEITFEPLSPQMTFEEGMIRGPDAPIEVGCYSSIGHLILKVSSQTCPESSVGILSAVGKAALSSREVLGELWRSDLGRVADVLLKADEIDSQRKFDRV